MREIGTLRALRRFPVKSMKGEELERGLVTFAGLAGDRVWAFVDPNKKTNFPWVTAREVPEMLLFEPRFVDPPPEVEKYPESARWRAMVRTPEGALRAIDDPAFTRELEARWNRPLVLRYSERGMQDSRPLSVFGMATLRELSAETGFELDSRRFRANFEIDWSDPASLYEESLIGKPLQIGDRLQLMITQRDTRCVIINLDPDTAVPDPRVLKTVGKSHAGKIGVYASVLKDGVAARGDKVFLLDSL